MLLIGHQRTAKIQNPLRKGNVTPLWSLTEEQRENPEHSDGEMEHRSDNRYWRGPDGVGTHLELEKKMETDRRN